MPLIIAIIILENILTATTIAAPSQVRAIISDVFENKLGLSVEVLSSKSSMCWEGCNLEWLFKYILKLLICALFYWSDFVILALLVHKKLSEI